MEVVAFILGVFGISAYLQISGLKNRIAALERELTGIKGTSYHEDRGDLVKMVNECIGKKVNIDLKEDHMDIDIINYGNTKHGSICIVDADHDWRLVHIETPKGNKDKLIRMESIEGLSIIKE